MVQDGMFNRSISKQDVQRIHNLTPKRRRFADHPAYKKSQNTDDKICFPFSNTLENLFVEETGLEIFHGRYGPYRFLKGDGEIAKAVGWEKARSQYVFLRDCLDASVALDYNLAGQGEYTELGLAEHRAKVDQDGKSIEKLAYALRAAIDDLPMYRRADLICAVPPSPGKAFDLPTRLVEEVAYLGEKPKLLTGLSFHKKNKSIKDLTLDEKWDALYTSGFSIAEDVKGCSIVLVDDKYQSGTTAQFVASRLLDAGAAAIFGLFCVKTWRDSDNS